ncbi:MAG: MTH938/NDUFAF3 family protein [Dehalococcoidia bacterium]
MNRIEGYGFGLVKIDGKRHYLRDVIVYPDETVGRRKFSRWVGSHHKLVIEDMAGVVEGGAKTVISGTGRFSGLKISDDLRDHIREAGIELIELPTGEAVKEFNELINRGNQNIGAFFHLMC